MNPLTCGRRESWRRLRRPITVLLFVCAALSACGGGSSTPDPEASVKPELRCAP